MTDLLIGVLKIPTEWYYQTSLLAITHFDNQIHAWYSYMNLVIEVRNRLSDFVPGVLVE